MSNFLNKTEKLIITISKHALWGAILQTALVSEDESGALTIVEIVTSKSSVFSELPDSARKIITLTEKLSDKWLMKSYSKEKNTADFLKKVSAETIDRYIRPFIESTQRKIIEILQTTNLQLYLREIVRTRVLYAPDRIIISRRNSQVVFNFIKDSHSGLRYFINVKYDDRPIDLYTKPYIVLCNEPGIIVVEKRLHIFSDIDAKKLIPFFSKNHIDVPASSEKTYIKKFVLNCVERYEVNAQGIEIRQIQPLHKATLTLGSDLNAIPALFLNFTYNNKKYPVDTPLKKHVFAEDHNNETTLTWFFPDKEWENHLINLLEENGLEKTGIGQFSLKRTSNDSSSETTYSLIEWISQHPDVLKELDFEQDQKGSVYFIGETKLEIGFDTKQDWFDLHCYAIFGEFRIPFWNFRNHILNSIAEYVLPDGSIAVLPREWFSRYFELMLFSKKTGEKITLKKHHFRLLEVLDEKNHEIFARSETSAILQPTPEGLKAELRNYQQLGFSWLVHLFENNFGGCLADDMGLGKTLQTIALLQHIASKQKKPTVKKTVFTEKRTSQTGESAQLTIFDMQPETDSEEKHKETDWAPPSLIIMPTSLIHNWKNELKRFAPGLRVYSYSGPKRARSKSIYKIFRHYNVILTTYGTVRNDIEILKECLFHHLILDESQSVKNPDSQAYRAVKMINAQHKLVLTGTPIENSLTDLWAQLNLVNEGMLGSYNGFRNAYINPINQNNKAKEEALLRMIQPFILRRTKDEVAPELPPLSEETVYCDMSDEQQTAYNAEKNKLRNSLLENKIRIDQQKMTFITLQGLTRLRLLANHPKLIDNNYSGDSGKFEQIMMRFETLKSENHKVLIFSSFVKHLRLLADYFDKENWKYAWLTGSTPAAIRENEIEKFRNNADVNCFFISLKAGGVGLNLTAADYVFIIDPWWNPASEMQALSRSHRIGQDKNVMVYRFISSETIEEKIRILQENKSKLAETFVTSNNPLANLKPDDMVELLD